MRHLVISQAVLQVAQAILEEAGHPADDVHVSSLLFDSDLYPGPGLEDVPPSPPSLFELYDLFEPVLAGDSEGDDGAGASGTVGGGTQQPDSTTTTPGDDSAVIDLTGLSDDDEAHRDPQEFSRHLADLTEDDLRCLESMPVSSDDENTQSAEEEFSLDCPAVPGYQCQSCEYHRRETGDPSKYCSLCYMRLTASMVYGSSVPDFPLIFSHRGRFPGSVTFAQWTGCPGDALYPETPCHPGSGP
nr:E1A protein [Lemur mastadenovirus]